MRAVLRRLTAAWGSLFWSVTDSCLIFTTWSVKSGKIESLLDRGLDLRREVGFRHCERM